MRARTHTHTFTQICIRACAHTPFEVMVELYRENPELYSHKLLIASLMSGTGDCKYIASLYAINFTLSVSGSRYSSIPHILQPQSQLSGVALIQEKFYTNLH